MRDVAVVQQSAPLSIKVVGVGGAGSNTVDRMIQAGLSGVQFIAANTDAQALAHSEASRRLQLGPECTRGLGVGGDHEWGARAAEESRPLIMEALRGADAVFIAAGMGGGTGTGAAPVVARIAREQGALTVAAVTRPFSFEGTHRQHIAQRGIATLTDCVHSLIVISNDRLLPVVGRTMSFDVALRVADDVLRQGIQGISELITRPGLVNLDFASIRTALVGAGGAIMAIGRGDGEGSATQAAQSALNSPLLDSQLIASAATILVNITGGPDLTLQEVSEAARLISETAHPEANILFGAVIDPEMGQESRVILVAGGIDSETVGVEATAGGMGALTSGDGVDQHWDDDGADTSPAKLVRDPLAEIEDRSRISQTGPGPLFWRLAPAAKRAASNATGESLEAATARAHGPVLDRAPTRGLDRSGKRGPMADRQSGQPSVLAHRNPGETSVSPDHPAAQTTVSGAAQDSEGQEGKPALGGDDGRQKLPLRFLPNLDLPAFLRR